MARGSIKKRSKNTWTITVDLPRDERGKRRQKRFTVEGRKSHAEAKLTQILNDMDKGKPIAEGKATVGKSLENWLREVTVSKRARTSEGYATLVHNHLIPNIGRVLLNKLTARHVTKMYTSLLEQGLSRNTVHHVHTCLSKALNDAIKAAQPIINWNVCTVVTPPSIGHYEVVIPEIDGIREILETAKETPYFAVLHLSANTGLRRSEVLALTWNDCDLEREILTITKSLQRLKGRGLVVEPTKSRHSRRGIALDARTIEILREHHGQQMLQKMQLGVEWNDGELMFPSPFGGPLDPATLTRNWEKLARKTGYSGLRLHDLRHSHASGLFRAGVHALVVKERLGHASAAFTVDVYGHTSAGMQSHAAAAFADLLAEKPD